MQIIEVTDRKAEEAFLRLPRMINKDNPRWIPHLDHDVAAVFDPKKNPQFQSGTLCRWILTDGNGNTIGRVAAFINEKLAYTYKQPTGGMGFFECINNKEAAFRLFDVCREWLQARGMQAMDGPINFGEKDRFWGLMVEGNEKETPYLAPNNPAYYRELFEAYGFQDYYQQFIFSLTSDIQLPPIIEKKFERLTETQGYHFENLHKKNLEKYAEDFMTIYNKAWSDAHESFEPMTREKAIRTFKRMKHVVDEELVIFGYHHGEPVAFFINILELNQIFRYLNGKLNWLGKLKFLYYKWRGKCRVIYGLVFGVIPEYQNRGLESALIMSLKNRVVPKGYYKAMIINWIGDFNPKMVKLMDHIGTEKAYTLITYRKLFSDEIAFERHPVLD